MGLCKCPKRKVTNQFCFEHRVNVCEHCIVQKHPKCVVQSYLQWLQDSDYSSKCELCDQDLSDEACVRFICYHVFHWVCIDKYARSLPKETAPAGYTCPKCQDCIFPTSNVISPVADALRNTLKDVNWARAGLGMPLLEEKIEKKPEFSMPTGPRPTPEGQKSPDDSSGGEQHPVRSLAKVRSDEIISFDTPTSRTSANKDRGINTEQLLTSPLLRDPDENKYQRKSALEMIIRWSKTIWGPSVRRSRNKLQRYLMVILILAFAFVTLIALLNYFGRSDDYTDPMLEPLNNPNIRVAD